LRGKACHDRGVIAETVMSVADVKQAHKNKAWNPMRDKLVPSESKVHFDERFNTGVRPNKGNSS